MTAPLEVDCPDAAATQRVGAAVAVLLEPGDVVLLDGDLGAGKTTFTQGLARALGVEDMVTSPTFTLVHSFPTAHGFDLCHVDVYRLESRSEIADLGLGEVLDEGAVAVVEWGQRAAPLLGTDHLDVSLVLSGGNGARRLSVAAHGPRWSRRLGDLGAALAGFAP